MLLWRDGFHQADAAAQHVDGRKVVALRQFRRQDHVAVENRLHLLGDRIERAVALDEHRIDAGDRADRRGAGPFEQAGQGGEQRRREAAPGRRLAGGEADLALGAGEARDAVHQQQHMLALVAEIFGDGGRQHSAP